MMETHVSHVPNSHHKTYSQELGAPRESWRFCPLIHACELITCYYDSRLDITSLLLLNAINYLMWGDTSQVMEEKILFDSCRIIMTIITSCSDSKWWWSPPLILLTFIFLLICYFLMIGKKGETDDFSPHLLEFHSPPHQHFIKYSISSIRIN